MNTYHLGDPNVIVPKEVAVCPECGASVEVEVVEIQEANDGKWRVSDDGSGLHIMCSEETDWHYRQPYIDWLPLDDKIVEWLNGVYEFQP